MTEESLYKYLEYEEQDRKSSKKSRRAKQTLGSLF